MAFASVLRRGCTATEQEARQQLLKPSIAEPFTKAGGRTAYLADRRGGVVGLYIELARREIPQHAFWKSFERRVLKKLAKLNQEAFEATAQTTCRPG